MGKKTKNKNSIYKEQKCVICGSYFKGFGNNAEPVKKGLCCDDCNEEVILTRIYDLIEQENKKNEQKKDGIETTAA